LLSNFIVRIDQFIKREKRVAYLRFEEDGGRERIFRKSITISFIDDRLYEKLSFGEKSNEMYKVRT